MVSCQFSTCREEDYAPVLQPRVGVPSPSDPGSVVKRVRRLGIQPLALVFCDRIQPPPRREYSNPIVLLIARSSWLSMVHKEPRSELRLLNANGETCRPLVKSEESDIIGRVHNAVQDDSTLGGMRVMCDAARLPLILGREPRRSDAHTGGYMRRIVGS